MDGKISLMMMLWSLNEITNATNNFNPLYNSNYGSSNNGIWRIVSKVEKMTEEQLDELVRQIDNLFASGTKDFDAIKIMIRAAISNGKNKGKDHAD